MGGTGKVTKKEINSSEDVAEEEANEQGANDDDEEEGHEGKVSRRIRSVCFLLVHHRELDHDEDENDQTHPHSCDK